MRYNPCSFKDSDSLLDFAIKLRIQTHNSTTVAEDLRAQAEALNGESSTYAVKLRAYASSLERHADTLKALEDSFLDNLSGDAVDYLRDFIEASYNDYSRKK